MSSQHMQHSHIAIVLSSYALSHTATHLKYVKLV